MSRMMLGIKRVQIRRLGAEQSTARVRDANILKVGHLRDC